MMRKSNCEKCFRYYNPVSSDTCSFCSDSSFHESILCDLNRMAQNDNKEIECFAFKHNLSVVGENQETYTLVEDDVKKEKLTERLKWIKAHALQLCQSDPDKVFFAINFHVCLITPKRENLFGCIENKVEEMSSIFNSLSKKFDSETTLLFLAHDHIHLHINASPDYPPDDIINDIMHHSESAIKLTFPDLFSDKREIFDRTYFTETIG